MAQSKSVRLVTEAALDTSQTKVLAPIKGDIADLKVLGGLNPGSPNDASTSNFIETPGTLTHTALSAAIAQSTADLADRAMVAAMMPGGLLAVLLGDSLTAYNGGASTATPAQPLSTNYQSNGMHRWANIMLGHRLNIIGNSGIGGQESSQIRARLQTDALDLNPNIISILAGTNDDGAEDNTIENLQAMYDAALAEGITVLAHTIPPSVSAGTALEGYRQSVNAWIRAHVARTPGIILADIAEAWQDKSLGGFKAFPGLLHDGLHPNTAGAQVAGQVIANALARHLATPLAESTITTPPHNLLTNAYFAGTGTAAPTGWTLTGSAVTTSYLPRSEGLPGQRVQFAIPAGGTLTMTQNVALGGNLVVGDLIDFSVGFECEDLEPAGADQRITAYTQQYNGTSFSNISQDAYVDGGAAYSRARYPLAQGAFRTPASGIQAGMTLVQVVITVRGGGKYRFKEATLRNLTKIAAGVGPYVPPPVTNLIPNPAFETDTSGWAVVGGASATRATSESHSGTSSMQVVHTTDTTSGIKTAKIPVTSSKATTFSTWVKAPVGHNVRLVLHEYVAGGAYLTNTQGDVIGTGSWQQISNTRTTGATAGEVVVEVNKFGASAADAVTVYVDDVVLSQ